MAGILVLVLVRAWDPVEPGLRACVFRAVLDIPCPGCGLTRSGAALSRGAFQDAWALNPLAFLFTIEVVAGWVAWGVLGSNRVHRFVEQHAGTLALINAIPLFGLWLGRAATGTVPF